MDIACKGLPVVCIRGNLTILNKDGLQVQGALSHAYIDQRGDLVYNVLSDSLTYSRKL